MVNGADGAGWPSLRHCAGCLVHVFLLFLVCLVFLVGLWMASECEGPAAVMVYITHNARLGAAGVLVVIVRLGAAGVLVVIVSLGAAGVLVVIVSGVVKGVRHERGRLRLHARFLRPLKPTRSLRENPWQNQTWAGNP